MEESEPLLDIQVESNVNSVNSEDNSLTKAKMKLAWERARAKGFGYWQSFKDFLNERGDILSLAIALIVSG